MDSLQEIEQAVLQLSPQELGQFLEWVEEYAARVEESRDNPQYPLRGMPFRYKEPWLIPKLCAAY